MLRLTLVLLVALTGCTSTRVLDPGSAGGARANHAFAEKTVQLTYADGTTVDAFSVVVHGDSTAWIDPATRALVRVPTSRVAHVTEHSRGRGAVQGALLTGLASAVTTGAIAVAGSGDWGRYNDAKPAFGLAVGTMAFVPGAAAGGVVGALRGSERRYDVLPADATATAPPSHAAQTERRRR